MRGTIFAVVTIALGAELVAAQTFKRLGACPSLGCVFPPDHIELLAGQHFDIRLEVHAPVNGTEASHDGKPDEKFTFSIQKDRGHDQDAARFFDVKEPTLEKWTFSYFEDLFAKDANQPIVVNVASKAYRDLAIYTPGQYTATLTYYGGSKTIVHWTVRDPPKKRKAKNVLLFIGDGMTQNMITAARMIGHKSVNGRYQSLLQMDQMQVGIQMTHSLDSIITDSANSATAMYSGKKSNVNALNVYADSSANSFDDPKFETIAEIFRRVNPEGGLGIVSTAFVADATPAALCSHTRDRNQAREVIFEYLHSPAELNSTIPWSSGCKQPDVIFGGGAENFIPGPSSPGGKDYYKEFAAKGYKVVHTNKELQAAGNKDKMLGIFSVSNLAKWVDRNVLKQNLRGQNNSATGDGTDAIDQPGLKEMTLKAIDVLQARSKSHGWFMMSEAASIDKMMHVLDYDRALGELLELDDTIRAAIQHLEKIGELDDTLIVVTADHGHGFDVFGGADTKYLAAQKDDRHKRNAIGVYQNSGLSAYTVANGSLPNNDTVIMGEFSGFPINWKPRYTYAAGFGANPDHRESYAISPNGPRLPATPDASGQNVVNPKDNPDGFTVEGTLPVNEPQGVHSLTDVPVYSTGPGSEVFMRHFDNTDLFFGLADALGLGRTSRH